MRGGAQTVRRFVAIDHYAVGFLKALCEGISCIHKSISRKAKQSKREYTDIFARARHLEQFLELLLVVDLNFDEFPIQGE